jgi:hypothetical protein
MPKLIRITTAPLSLKVLLSGQMKYMNDNGFEVVMVSSDGKELEEVKQNEGCRHHIFVVEPGPLNWQAGSCAVLF